MTEWPNLTDEQRDNLMRYGFCFKCGAPREEKTKVDIAEDGKETVTRSIICPNGHPQ